MNATPVRPPQTIPGDTLRAEFRDHNRRTGTPETFPGLKFDRPDAEWRFAIIDKFCIKRAQRPNSDMIPCAVCCPNDPKFLDGYLTFDLADGALRLIGRTCGSDHDKAVRDEALERFNREERQRQIKAYLKRTLPHLSLYLQRAKEVQSAAEYASELSTRFRLAKTFFYRVSDEVRRHGAGTWEEEFVDPQGKRQSVRHREALSGLGFLEPKFNPERDARKALEGLQSIGLENEASVVAWERENVLRPSERERVHKALSSALRDLETAEAGVATALAFLARTNITALQRWLRRRSDLKSECRIGFTDYEFRGEPRDGVAMVTSLRVNEARLKLPAREAKIRAHAA